MFFLGTSWRLSPGKWVFLALITRKMIFWRLSPGKCFFGACHSENCFFWRLSLGKLFFGTCHPQNDFFGACHPENAWCLASGVWRLKRKLISVSSFHTPDANPSLSSDVRRGRGLASENKSLARLRVLRRQTQAPTFVHTPDAS